MGAVCMGGKGKALLLMSAGVCPSPLSRLTPVGVHAFVYMCCSFSDRGTRSSDGPSAATPPAVRPSALLRSSPAKRRLDQTDSPHSVPPSPPHRGGADTPRGPPGELAQASSPSLPLSPSLPSDASPAGGRGNSLALGSPLRTPTQVRGAPLPSGRALPRPAAFPPRGPSPAPSAYFLTLLPTDGVVQTAPKVCVRSIALSSRPFSSRTPPCAPNF